MMLLAPLFKQDNTVANMFPCKIVTPTEECFDGQATYVSFPSWDGQYGMMKGLAPLLSRLAPGTLRIDTEGESRSYLIEGGFAHVDSEGLSLVTEGAILAEELNLEEAKAELAEANARVISDVKDRVAVERAQKIATAKVALASKS
jgi:F-type H+-transporting ATPase subunit epsilon